LNTSFNKILYIILLLLISVNNFAQLTKVRGTVVDKDTKEPIPFANVYFKGTNTGTITDFNGYYFLESRNASDSLAVSFLGYKDIVKKITQHHFQEVNFEIKKQGITLQEVKIVPGENPAFAILRKIIANKKKNSPSRLKSYQYEVYNKMEIDMNNIDDKFKNRKVFKNFQFVFDYIDTSAISGKAFLPIFISETLSDYYYNKNPEKHKEIIKANKISGIQNESVSEFTGQMYQNVDIYKNYISVFGKTFISPIANFGKLYYKYYLIDSAYIDNHWCYQLSFKPKNKNEPTFTGDIWIADTSFAVKKFKIRLTKDANINFVTDMVDEQNYTCVNGKWMLKKDKLLVDFNVANKTIGFFGRKTTSYSNIKVNEQLPDSIYKRIDKQDVEILSDANNKSNEYWNKSRHDTLSERELNIYNMIDSIQNVPVFKSYVEIIYTIFSGYWDIGKVQIGQYVKLFSYNKVEGYRFRLGAKTDIDFSKNIFLDGYVAYGLNDKKFKYHAGLKYIFNTRKYLWTSFFYTNDLEQLGQSPNALSSDNLLGSLFKRRINDKLNSVEEYNFQFEKEWKHGLTNKITLAHRTLFPLGDTKFLLFEKSSQIEKTHITTFEITLNTRFAYNEKFVEFSKIRTSLGTKYPIIDINYILGLSNVFNSDYNFQKIYIGYTHHFKINPIGTMYYGFVVGKIFDKLPYPLLEIHTGNETYWYDSYAFNLMNYYEFISDEFISFSATHHFEGFFLNKIPLFKKLKWREVVSLKGVDGRLSKRNKDFTVLPEGMSYLTKPYYEGSVGIENIFTVFRVDWLWRFSYLDHPNIAKYGIRLKVEFNF